MITLILKLVILYLIHLLNGRDTERPGTVDDKWRFIPMPLRVDWGLIDSGIDQDTGLLTRPECEVRDYPKLNELAMNLKASSTKLMVIMTGDDNVTCKEYDVTQLKTIKLFWDMVADVMNEYGVPFIYHKDDLSLTGVEHDLSSTIGSILIDLIGDECPPSTSTTNRPESTDTTVSAVTTEPGESTESTLTAESTESTEACDLSTDAIVVDPEDLTLPSNKVAVASVVGLHAIGVVATGVAGLVANALVNFGLNLQQQHAMNHNHVNVAHMGN